MAIISVSTTFTVPLNNFLIANIYIYFRQGFQTFKKQFFHCSEKFALPFAGQDDVYSTPLWAVVTLFQRSD